MRERRRKGCDVMAKLTDKQRKKVVADYIEMGSYRAVARKYKIADQTVKRIVQADADFMQNLAQKKEENTADILAYMEGKKDVVCGLIGTCLEVLSDPEKLKSANVSQVATAMAIVIDKFTGGGNGGKGSIREIENLRPLAQMLKDDTDADNTVETI